MTYSDWVRFCGSRMLPIRRSVPKVHPSMKMSSTPYGLLHGDFYVISTSISRCLSSVELADLFLVRGMKGSVELVLSQA
ncbi:hypothetical protein ANTRET_LOCUS2389 [Anthophora retusa]